MAQEQLRGRKVLVTGGAGFIGSHLSERLVEIGAEVLCLDDLSAGKRSNVAHLEDRVNFRFVEASVCDTGAVIDELFQGLDTVFHNAASKKNICLINPHRDLEVNAGGTLNLLQKAREHVDGERAQAEPDRLYQGPAAIDATRESDDAIVTLAAAALLNAADQLIEAAQALLLAEGNVLLLFFEEAFAIVAHTLRVELNVRRGFVHNATRTRPYVGYHAAELHNPRSSS